MNQYLFTSARLGFREWQENDCSALAEINADEEVMKYFPRPLSQEETRRFIGRMQEQYTQRSFCYFAVEKLENKELIGFIGISEQDFEEDFTPCIDVGWRLKRSAWGNGYATEGAKTCLHFAFHTIGLNKVYAMAPLVNEKSIGLMKRLGMRKVKTFGHPKLQDHDWLKSCALYEIRKDHQASAPD